MHYESVVLLCCDRWRVGVSLGAVTHVPRVGETIDLRYVGGAECDPTLTEDARETRERAAREWIVTKVEHAVRVSLTSTVYTTTLLVEEAPRA